MSTPNTQKKLEQMQQTCKSILTSFQDERADINRQLGNYKFILTHYKNKTLYDDKCRECIFNFLVSSCQALMHRKYINFKNDYNMADTTIECCKLLIEIAIPFITNNAKWAAQIIHECLNGSTSAFFTTFGHDWRQYRGSMLQPEEVKNDEEWRSNGITVGGHIDYLMCNRWHYGEIKKIVDKKSASDGRNFQLLFIHRKMQGIYNNLDLDEWTFSKSTYCQISQPLTKSLLYLPHMSEWRKNLNETKNNRCDFYNTNGIDYICHVTIVETDVATNRVRIKLDNENPSLFIWIARDSICIQPFGTNDNVKIIEYDNDPKDENIFAIYRGKLNNESFHIIEMLNSFGKYGGFDAVLELLSNIICFDISLLSLYLPVLSMCYKSYTKSFGQKFMPVMYKLVIQILESLHVNQLSELEFLDTTIAISISNLMYRYYTLDIIQETQIKWQSQITISVLHCASERINTEMDNLLAFIGLKCMVNWVRNNNIWRCLLGLTNVILCKSDVLITGYIRQYFNKEMSIDLLNLMQMWFEDYSNSDNMIYLSKLLKFMDNQNQITDMDMNMFFNAMICTVIINKECIKVLSGVVINRWDIIGPMIMKRCIHNLIQHKYVIAIYTILMSLWKLSRTSEYIMIGHMIDNEKLLQYYFNDIKYFKCYVRMSITDDMDASEINDMKLFIDQNSYLEHVEGRINFLNYISVHYNALKLTNIEKNMLYQEFVENALTKEEKEMAITRLKSIMELDDTSV